MVATIQELADTLVLGALLDEVRARFGRYDLVDHWKQGEFHHDVVVRVHDRGRSLPGDVLVIATNCNGGVKEVLCFDVVPDRGALWRWRCPEVNDFSGDLPPIHARAVTHHWFDPCELLVPEARSELREEVRQRQPGGGWEMAPMACGSRKSACNEVDPPGRSEPATFGFEARRDRWNARRNRGS
jgi:hypothetical protein